MNDWIGGEPRRAVIDWLRAQKQVCYESPGEIVQAIADDCELRGEPLSPAQKKSLLIAISVKGYSDLDCYDQWRDDKFLDKMENEG